MSRRGVTNLLLALVASGCATAKPQPMAPVAAQPTESPEVEAARRRYADAAKRCDAVAAQPETFEEEQSWGDIMTLYFVRRSKGVALEPSPGLANEARADAVHRSSPEVKAPTGPLARKTAWVNRVGKALAAHSQRPALDWVFVIVDDEVPRVASAPNGTVVLSTALLAACADEAQLAFALAHEVAHVTARDAVKAWKPMRRSVCMADLSRAEVAVTLNGQAPRPAGLSKPMSKQQSEAWLTDQAIQTLSLLGYGTAVENEADATAVELMVFTGYDPRRGAAVLGTLPEGAGHPWPTLPNQTRLTHVEKVIAEQFADLPLDLLVAPALPPESQPGR